MFTRDTHGSFKLKLRKTTAGLKSSPEGEFGKVHNEIQEKLLKICWDTIIEAKRIVVGGFTINMK